MTLQNIFPICECNKNKHKNLKVFIKNLKIVTLFLIPVLYCAFTVTLTINYFSPSIEEIRKELLEAPCNVTNLIVSEDYQKIFQSCKNISKVSFL